MCDLAPQWQSVGVCAAATKNYRSFHERQLNALLGACALGLCRASCDCPNARTASPTVQTAYSCSARAASAREAYGQPTITIDSATDGLSPAPAAAPVNNHPPYSPV